MKKAIVAIVLAGLVSSPAFAISHAHRAKLASTGCTQVQEANGECGNNNAMSAAAKAREWDRLHSQPGNAPTKAERRDNARHLSTDYHTQPVLKGHSDKYPLCEDLPVDATNWQRKNCID